MKSKTLLLYMPLNLALLVTSSMGFATAPNGWALPAVTLSNDPLIQLYNTADNSLSMAMDNTGNTLATWVSQYQLVSYLIIARYQAGTNMWDSPVQKIQKTANVFSKPILHMTPDGDAFIMWRENDAAPYYPMATKFPQGTSWATWTPAIVQLSTTFTLPLAQLAINNLGDALFISGSPDGYISNFYSHTQTWSVEPLTEASTTISASATDLNIAIDNNGDGIAVFITTPNIFASQYQASTWGTPIQLNTTGSTASNVQLCMDPASGIAYIMWIENNTSVRAIQYVPANWPSFTTQTIETVISLTVDAIQESIDETGNVTFMWSANGLSTGSLHTAYFNNSAWESWVPTVIVLTSSSFQPIIYWTVGIQPSSPYTVFALWELNNGSQYLVQSNQATTGSWLSAQTIYQLGNNRSQKPQINIDASGNAAVVWGQVASQIGTAAVMVNTLLYNATNGWLGQSTILSNSGYCDCTSL